MTRCISLVRFHFRFVNNDDATIFTPYLGHLPKIKMQLCSSRWITLEKKRVLVMIPFLARPERKAFLRKRLRDKHNQWNRLIYRVRGSTKKHIFYLDSPSSCRNYSLYPLVFVFVFIKLHFYRS